MLSTETITVAPCPICGLSHDYRLAVERSTIIKMMTMDEPQRGTRFTRLFNCPKQNERFQATFVLSGDIESVKVLGTTSGGQ
jgi:hypothetical protein